MALDGGEDGLKFYKKIIEQSCNYIENGYLNIQPCIPSDWKEYSIKYKHGNSVYNIHVSNPNGKNNTVQSFKLNGQEIPDKKIELNSAGGVYSIEILM